MYGPYPYPFPIMPQEKGGCADELLKFAKLLKKIEDSSEVKKKKKEEDDKKKKDGDKPKPKQWSTAEVMGLMFFMLMMSPIVGAATAKIWLGVFQSILTR